MPFGRTTRDDPGLLRLSRGERLTTLERVAVLVFLVVVTFFDVIGLISTPDIDPIGPLFSIAATVVFAFYLWWPPVATILLGSVFLLSFVVGQDSIVLIPAAVAAGMVMRLGSTALVLAYAGGFLVATAAVAYGDHRVPVNVGIYLVVAAVAGALGYALRLASARGNSLERRLAESAEQERQAVLAERRWIAGELHDSIAHHLTVVALHVQMLDDPDMTTASQEAIRVAARKAMADLRFVIELADDGPRVAGVHTGDLDEAIGEAISEIDAAGHTVRAEGSPLDERIPRVADIVFARIVRESATNILKHAGPGEVLIRLDVDDEHAALTIRSPLPQTPRRDLPSSGTGLNRMAERVIGASGEFSAGPSDGAWQVFARLPLS
ncbi:sensor histidine kinase [Microbacterium suwonense]|uniref:Signal transduction histidine kinase subgroup 3 dimerisation and phosphoacceptor domain-containing protein n=1 Tax=Microbacterium suwonense TaxID=683047 RepID=A0ABN6X8H1_9MICO|nr:histidine kinase [Microbacterium suwonense]BDZ40515.1 hypothetical protein GCM10025863_31290 [Microbacterium suwonense]